MAMEMASLSLPEFVGSSIGAVRVGVRVRARARARVRVRVGSGIGA